MIEHWLNPADRADVLRHVASLTMVMKLRNWDQSTSKGLLETYALDLADQPLFAIQDACTAFRRKSAGDGWMPTPGDFREEVIRKAAWLRKEAIEIGRVLDASADDDEAVTDDRAAMKNRFAELSASLRMAPPPRNERRSSASVAEPPDLRHLPSVSKTPRMPTVATRSGLVRQP